MEREREDRQTDSASQTIVRIRRQCVADDADGDSASQTIVRIRRQCVADADGVVTVTADDAWCMGNVGAAAAAGWVSPPGGLSRRLRRHAARARAARRGDVHRARERARGGGRARRGSACVVRGRACVVVVVVVVMVGDVVRGVGSLVLCMTTHDNAARVSSPRRIHPSRTSLLRV